MLWIDLDAEVNEAASRPAGKNVGHGEAGHIVEHVLRLDEAAGSRGAIDIAGVDPPMRRLIDVRKDQARVQGADLDSGRERIAALIGPHGDGGVGQLGRDLLEPKVRLLDVLLYQTHCGDQPLRSVGEMVVQTERSCMARLEEEQIEGRQALFSIAVVEPNFGGINATDVSETGAISRLSQDDVHPSPVGLPAGYGCLSAEQAVGMLDAAVMLLLELIDLGERIRIPPAPVRGGESVALLNRLEVEKNSFSRSLIM